MIYQLSVFLENRAGQLAQITGILAENHIDLRAINIADTADYGVLRMIASDNEKAAELLRGSGFILSLTPVVAVAVPDEPGALNCILQITANENIDIEYMYSVFGKEQGKAVMLFRVNEPDRLSAALQTAGFAPETEL